MVVVLAFWGIFLMDLTSYFWISMRLKCAVLKNPHDYIQEANFLSTKVWAMPKSLAL